VNIGRHIFMVLGVHMDWVGRCEHLVTHRPHGTVRGFSFALAIASA
jgi:hypothetical protein